MQADSAKQQQLALEALVARQQMLQGQQTSAAAELRAFKEHASGLLTTLQTQVSQPASVTGPNFVATGMR